VIPSAAVRDESLETAVERLSLQAASAIETVDDSLFELSVDIVVGKTKGLVVIEVNSKPGHRSYRHLAKMEELPVEVRRKARDQERASFRRIVDEVERRVG
jgi:glutathione synthase/RimK-type ligase-like ATP-grasp enzyme